MFKKIIGSILSVIMVLIPLTVFAQGSIPVTNFSETDPNGYITTNSTRVTYTGIKNSNVTQSLSLAVADVAENSSFNIQWGYKQTAQTVSSGSSVLFVGYGTANYSGQNSTIDPWTSTGNYSLGARFYQTGTGVKFNLVEAYNGTIYYSANTDIGLNDPKYFQLSRNDTSNLSYLKIYNDASYSSLNISFNLTLHSKPAFTYLFFPIAGCSGIGSTSMTGYIENLYRNDTPESITVTTGYLTPVISPFLQYATINASQWLGNITDYGFRAGSGNGTWDYTASTIIFSDIYGVYNGTSNASFSTYFYGISANQTLYYQGFAGGYDSFGVYKTFYGDIRSFTNNMGAGISQFTVNTGVPTQITDPVTNNPAVILSGSVSGSNNPVTAWGFMVGNTSASVANLSASGVQIAHTGNQTNPVFSEWYDYDTTWTIVYVRAWAIDSDGNVALGSEKTMSTTPVIDPSLTLTAPTIVGNYASFMASISPGAYVSQSGFAYGTTYNLTNAITVIKSENISSQIYGITTGWLTLAPGTTYYFRGQIYTNNKWVYSGTTDNFTTGVSMNVTTSAPVVITYPAWFIGDTSFNTSVYINGSNLTAVGVQLRNLSDTNWTASYSYTGVNMAGGTYNITVSGLTANTTYYYRAFGLNIYAPTIDKAGTGSIYIITTLPIAPTPLVIPPLPGVVTPIEATQSIMTIVKNSTKTMGMDNTPGHLIFGLGISILLGVLVAYMVDRKKKKYGVKAGLIVAVIVFSALLLGGFFDAVTVLVIVSLVAIFIALGLLKILEGRKSSGGLDNGE